MRASTWPVRSWSRTRRKGLSARLTLACLRTTRKRPVAGCPIWRSLTQSLSIAPPWHGNVESSAKPTRRRARGTIAKGDRSEGGGNRAEAVEDHQDHRDASEQEGDDEDALQPESAGARFAQDLLVLGDVAQPSPVRLADSADLIVGVEKALAQ